jgi:hypothetical protein
MRKFFAVTAIAACSLLMAGSAAQAHPGAGISFPSPVIQVQSRACECQDSCRSSVVCHNFCSHRCRGVCAVRYRLSLRACLRRCGVCRPQ